MAGTVTPGKRADLVLLAADPLKDIANSRRIEGVVIGGRWIDKKEIDRRLADIRQTYAKSRARLEGFGPP